MCAKSWDRPHRPAEKLLPSAYLLAAKYDRTVYDSLYLALAVASDTQMATADQRLVNALANTDLAAHMLWIGASKGGDPGAWG